MEYSANSNNLEISPVFHIKPTMPPSLLLKTCGLLDCSYRLNSELFRRFLPKSTFKSTKNGE
jgi:hypothetical protein